MLTAGMTDEEANCWELAAKLAGGMFALPDPHPMDNHEIAQAIHVIQNKLLARPTYRRYLQAAKDQEAKAANGGGEQDDRSNPK